MSNHILAGKVALVTGGTSGIGAASAKALARAGASVVITGRRETQGHAVVKEIQALGAQALFFRADAAREPDAAAMVAHTVKTFGRLDIAFNNAGVEGATFVPVTQQTEENYRQVFDVNVAGVLYAMKHEIPALKAAGGGSIINTASIGGVIGFGGMSVYAASKWAVIGLTKSVALELAKEKIRVNAVSPGAVESEMYDRFAPTDQVRQMMAAAHPVGRAGTADEIAAAVVFLASPQASFVTGTNLLIDGGFTAQ